MNIEKEFDFNSTIKLPDDLKKYSDQDWNVFLSPSQARWFVIPKGVHSKVFLSFQKMFTIESTYNKILKETKWKDDEVLNIIQDVLSEIIDKTINTNAEFDKIHKYKTLKIFSTNKCNLNCIHCYRYNEKASNNDLNINEWYKIIEEHKSLGGDSVLISGGEPFSEIEKLFSILETCKKNNLSTAIITNATLIKKNHLERLQLLVDEIQISLDGPEPVSANMVRGNNNFEKVIDSLRLLKDLNTKIFLAMTPIPPTLNSFKENLTQFISYLNNEFGENRIILKLTREILDGRDIKKLGAEGKINFEQEIQQIEKSVFGDEYNDVLNSTFYEPGLIQKSCGIGLSIGIQPNGNVYACDLDNTLVANIREKSLSTIRNLLEKIEHENAVDFLIPCNNCDLRYLCGGPCRLEINSEFRCSEKFKHNIIKNLIGLNKYRYES